jgi:hypothetical protein
MTLRIGSAVLVPGEDRVQRITRLGDHEGEPSAWFQAMMGDKAEKGPVLLSELQSGVVFRPRSGI